MSQNDEIFVEEDDERPIYSFTDKDIYQVYFRELTVQDLNSNWKSGKSQIVCTCGKVLAKQANGYTNASNHVKSQHSANYKAVLQDHMQSKISGQNSIMSFVSVPKAALNMYGWLDWVIMDNLPFCFVEKKRSRKNSSLTAISLTAFMKYLRRLRTAVYWDPIVLSKLYNE